MGRRMKTRLLAVTASLALFAAMSPASANVIVNGSFESPSIGSEFYQNYGTETNPTNYVGPSFLGWTVKPDTNVDIVNPSGIGAWGVSAYSGNQILDLVGYGSTGGIQQIFSTVSGKTYLFSFAYGNNPGSTADTGAAADFHIYGASPLLAGSVSHDTSEIGNLNWSIYTGTFVADSSLTGLRFNTTFGINNGGILLDAVSISAVPEASTWIMMLIGFAAVGFAAYRRTKKAALAIA
jgi:hypothetical protein